MNRPSYSQRTGKATGLAALTLDDLKWAFSSFYKDLKDGGYFQEYLGYECVDHGFVSGSVGSDLKIALLVALRKAHLWPIEDTIEHWTEDDVFDVLEFLYDRTSKPTSGRLHDYNNCGWHFDEFHQASGRITFRERMNPLLAAYSSGFELSETGEVLSLADDGLQPLLEAEIPESAPENVRGPMQAAIRKFRRHRASNEDRLDAIRDLAGALEFIRPQVKKFFSKDEGDIFNLANNFAIRHNNSKQQGQYDNHIWYSWMFNYYLATLHATLRMMERPE